MLWTFYDRSLFVILNCAAERPAVHRIYCATACRAPTCGATACRAPTCHATALPQRARKKKSMRRELEGKTGTGVWMESLRNALQYTGSAAQRPAVHRPAAQCPAAHGPCRAPLCYEAEDMASFLYFLSVQRSARSGGAGKGSEVLWDSVFIAFSKLISCCVYNLRLPEKNNECL